MLCVCVGVCGVGGGERVSVWAGAGLRGGELVRGVTVCVRAGESMGVQGACASLRVRAYFCRYISCPCVACVQRWVCFVSFRFTKTTCVCRLRSVARLAPPCLDLSSPFRDVNSLLHGREELCSVVLLPQSSPDVGCEASPI